MVGFKQTAFHKIALASGIGNRAGKDTFFRFNTRYDLVLEARSVFLLPQTPIFAIAKFGTK